MHWLFLFGWNWSFLADSEWLFLPGANTFKGRDPGMDNSRDSVLLLLSLTHIVFEKLIQIHCAIRDTNYFYSSILFVNKIQDGVVVYI